MNFFELRNNFLNLLILTIILKKEYFSFSYTFVLSYFSSSYTKHPPGLCVIGNSSSSYQNIYLRSNIIEKIFMYIYLTHIYYLYTTRLKIHTSYDLLLCIC